jgi:hypothetical protein
MRVEALLQRVLGGLLDGYNGLLHRNEDEKTARRISMDSSVSWLSGRYLVCPCELLLEVESRRGRRARWRVGAHVLNAEWE